jgi:hypothetical protein
MRRLIAVAGASAASGPAHVVVDTHVPPPASAPENVAPDTVGEPVVVHEFRERFRTDDGLLCTVRAYGQGRADGTWIGWLAFIGPDGVITRRTARETTQSSREHLAYWATGLQPSYLEGSFTRAT